MKFYLKGFYGYKNFGDEMLFFGLLNYLQKNYNSELFAVEVGDKQRMQSRTQQNKLYLDNGILDKLEFVENAVVSKRFRQLLSFLGFDKYKKYFKVFGGGEILDESRGFPHNGRNLPILHRYSIRKGQFILVGGIGTDNKKFTKKLYSYLLPKAQKIICRELKSVQRAQKYIKNKSNILLHKDFSKELLDGVKDIKQDKNILINMSPKYFNKTNLKKIKKYVEARKDIVSVASVKPKIIFFPADINLDKQYYTQLRKIIPDLEIYDWTKHSLSETIDLFKSCVGGVGSRLHFLYPLKIFKKDLLSISNSDKVEKMIPHPTSP